MFEQLDGAGNAAADPGGTDTGGHIDLFVRDVARRIVVDEGYLIGDAEVIPPEEEAFYCEKILRVPASYLAFEVLYPVPDVVDRDGAIDPGSIRGDIEFDHVDFGYGDGKLVLQDFCLKVK